MSKYIYIDLLSDFGFKRIFGTEANKDLLIAFLNQFFPDDSQVKDLTYLKTEHIGTIKEDRIAVFDIYCKSVKGDHFIVELQRIKQENFKDRCLFYASQVIQQQAPKGKWNFELMPIYTIGILDFLLDDYKEVNTLLHQISLRDEQGNLFSHKMTYIYIELSKFTKNLEELETPFDKWLFVFRWLSQLKSRPKALQERIFQKIFDIAKIANFTPMERSQYEISLKIRRDNENTRDYERKEALREGRAEGKAEGIEEEQVEVLKSGIEEGLTLAILAKLLRMSVKEVKALAKKYGLILNP